MEFKSYNAELGVANILFQRLFSNIEIERTDKNGDRSWLKVPCVNAQRSRIIKSLENRDRRSMYKLPMISFSRTGYSRAGDRLNNLHNEVKYEITTTNRNYQLLTPIPIDISYELTITAKYQADIDKIASNFMVFFNNDIYVSQEHPKFKGIKLNNQVRMEDSVSEDHPDEFDGSQDDIVTSTFSFTFKTFLFGGMKQAQKLEKQVSSYVTTVLSDCVYEFQSDAEVMQYLSTENHNKLSTIIQQEVTATVSTYVETSSDEYDDGIPKINRIDFGFYAVPTDADITAYMASVDNELICKHEHYTSAAYISSESYGVVSAVYVDEEGISSLVPHRLSSDGDYYEPVDNWCTLAPYVDRIRWKIDATSTKPYPYNVKQYGDFEDLT